MASTFLSRTPSVAGDRRTFTFSFWFKRGNLSSIQHFFTNQNDLFGIESGNYIFFAFNGASAGTFSFVNTLLRDVSAWYHIVLTVDTTDATGADRLKLYINGERITPSSSTPPSQNYESAVNNTQIQVIGKRQSNNDRFLDGSLAHFHFIDGTAYDASAFGQTDSTTGIWTPKISPSVTYGTNGFFLKFASSGSMGTDSSGNGNNFSVGAGNLTQIQDTPTNIFMTLNPLAKASLAGNPYNGNLTHIGQTSGYGQTVLGTLSWQGGSGKWYWEMKQGGASAGNYGFVRTDKLDGTNGVGNIVQTTSSTPTECIQYDWAWGVNPSNGNKRHDGSNDAYGSGLSSGDIGMVAVDTVAGKVWWGKNGTWFASGDPASGTNPAFTDSDITEGVFTIYSIVSDTDGRSKSYNFGNGYFGTTAVSSANSDGGGIGLFEYEVPSGYYALCTKNINTYG